MLKQIFRKWWVILIQGILLIILSFFIFNNPVAVLAGLSVWVGLLVLAIGVIGISSWLMAEKFERDGVSLAWGIVSVIVGILMIKNLIATMVTISVLFGLWMLITGIWLSKNGWSLKDKSSLGWALVIIGVFSIIAGVMMIFNVGVGATGISILLGLQVLLAGIAFVIFSFAKKNMAEKITERVSNFKAKYN
jgi:uncharacterized membrane protein HdeD (DUF308 family)